MILIQLLKNIAETIESTRIYLGYLLKISQTMVSKQFTSPNFEVFCLIFLVVAVNMLLILFVSLFVTI